MIVWTVEGTASRDLWKLSCWEMAKDVRKRVNETENDKNFSFLQSFYSVHEKAIYAALQETLLRCVVCLYVCCFGLSSAIASVPVLV